MSATNVPTGRPPAQVVLDPDARWLPYTGSVELRHPVGGISGGVVLIVGNASTVAQAWQLVIAARAVPVALRSQMFGGRAT